MARGAAVAAGAAAASAATGWGRNQPCYGGYGDAGVYAHRSYVTGRPTLFPRCYGGGKLRCVDQIAVTPFALEIAHALTPEISGRKT